MLIDMGLLISWALVAFGLFVADKLVSDFDIAGDWKSYVVVAAVVGIVNFFVGWFIYGVLVIGSLGLGWIFSTVTRIVTSAIVLKIADAMSTRFTIKGFLPAVWAAIILAVTSGLGDFLLRH
jgi:putative membrane protein